MSPLHWHLSPSPLSSPPPQASLNLLPIIHHNPNTGMGTHLYHHHNTPKTHHLLLKKLIIWALYTIIPLALLHLYLFPLFSPPPQPNATLSPSSSSSSASSTTTTTTFTSSSSSSSQAGVAELKKRPSRPRCNYSDGQWVRHSGEPRYSGTGCKTIKEGQNCMAHGRPDTGYLHWRWQPKQCAVPAFDPAAFLRLIENRHLAFIGDSMARNQLESLLCLLATAEEPELVYRDGEDNKFRRWVFRGRNATVSVLWSPFLVKGVEKSEATGQYHNNLYLESVDERWASELDGMDVVVFSVGHWYLHPAFYHENGVVLGCHHCPEFNYTEIGFFDVFRKALNTTLREVSRRHDSSPGTSEKLVVVTTFSPAHFDGEWDKAGACPKKEPYKEGEKEMEYMDAEMRKIEVEEVAAAAERGGGKGLRFEALDVTKMALMRPDGHPGPYMHPNPFANGAQERMQNDCVHWCLPGPIDSWNEILLEMMRRWKGESK
ncbi:xyloglucan O-acetyltransferase 1-like [Musa acuminata AAA Group]|uniref:xyloglucan O-acetyltransferase 1-like n=1 Tax=Musa acuminata AAA Group TaxID=214697 RepID=UPI0031DA403D